MTKSLDNSRAKEESKDDKILA
ncbi:hypothetical protein LNTAR_04051 [Lentisphaera araneosa HTCC2155]|uniref:Uncharacterized protein n=1 Tax=Lentisphaera araneosa HTCC2155 TaxID=313628 RepID=A6DTV6_9BACT|nr:hypothetical protein LNTAR_04051 [Lentisphaera araneosa HTCC2155]